MKKGKEKRKDRGPVLTKDRAPKKIPPPRDLLIHYANKYGIPLTRGGRARSLEDLMITIKGVEEMGWSKGERGLFVAGR